MIVESGIIDCGFVNVAAVERHVAIQLINASTGAVANATSGAIATPPGRFNSVGAVAPGGFSGYGFCKFTVLDEGGTKADIRASLLLTPNIGGDETTSVEVSAQ